MNYFVLYKTDKKANSEKALQFRGGYSFKKKTIITLYNHQMTSYILIKKFNKSLKDIINLYLFYANSEDEDGTGDAVNVLGAKVEMLRAVLLEQYSLFLDRPIVEDYLNKLEKMERKIGSLHQVKKSRSM